MIISFLSLFLSISDQGLIFLSLSSQIRVSSFSLSFGLRFGFVCFLCYLVSISDLGLWYFWCYLISLVLECGCDL